MSRVYYIKKFEFFLLGIIFYFILGCSLLNTKSDKLDHHNEVDLLNQAEIFLNEGRLEEAKKQFIDFQVKFPNSKYFLSAQLGQGQSLEMLGQLDEAIEIYQKTYEKSLKANGVIAASAQYRQSFCYEKKGDDFKALTLLLDLKPREDFLPISISKVQIPGRLALLYNKLGQLEESYFYQSSTAKNLELLKGQISPAQLSESYYSIGSLSTLQVRDENFESCLRGLKVSSYYLLSSVELNQQNWSYRSQELLKNQVKNLWTLILNLSYGKPGDRYATERQKYDRQTIMTNGLIDVLNGLNLRRPLNKSDLSSYQKEVFDYLSKIENEATRQLVNGNPRLELTRGKHGFTPFKKKSRNKKR